MGTLLPGMNRMKATRLIQARSPATEIGMLSSHDEDPYRLDAQPVSPVAFVSKSNPSFDWIAVLRSLLEQEHKPSERGSV